MVLKTSRYGGYGIVRRSHLREHLVKPLQRSVEVDLNPTGCAGDVLSVVFGPPAFDEAQTNGAHFGQFKDRLVAVSDGLTEHLSKLLVVEDLETAARGDLAHRGGVEAMVAVAVATLHKNTALRQALRKHLPSHVVQVQACGVVWRGVVWCGVVWCGVAWCDVA